MSTQDTTQEDLSRRHSRRVRRHTRRVQLRTNIEKRTGNFALLGVQALVLFVLGALPIMLGGRSVLSFSLAGIILLWALVLWTCSLILRGKVAFQSCQAFIIFALIFLVGGLQLWPEFSDWYTRFTPDDLATSIWADASTFLNTSLPTLMALAPAVHMEKLLFVGIAALLYILLCQCFNTEKSIFFLAYATFLITTAYAFLGLTRYLSQDPYFLWIYLGKSAAVAGPFVNRNSFVFMQELGVLLGMGLTTMLAHSNEKSITSQIFGKAKPYVLICMVFCIIISLLALLLTYSRGGILGAFIGLSLFIIFIFVRHARSRGTLLILFMIGATVFLLSSYGMDKLISRFDSMATGEDGSSLMRLETWKVAIELIAMSPYVGFGFGAFRYLGPMFDEAWRGNTIAFNVHNDFIELPFSLGIPCAALILFLLTFFFCRTLYRILIYKASGRHRTDTFTPWTYVGFGCLCGLVAISCHEFVDYGLQQPANLALTIAIAVIAGHVGRLLHEQKNGASTALKLGWKLGRPLYIVPVICAGLAYIISIPYVQSARIAVPLEKIRYVKNNPEATRTMSTIAIQDALKRQSQLAFMVPPESKEAPTFRHLFHYPERPEALLDYAKSQYQLGRLKLQALYGEKISAQLDRNVSGDRVWLEQYTGMRQAILKTLLPEERQSIANHYAQSAHAYERILQLSPSDAIALSGLALAVYSGAPWSENPSFERSRAYNYIIKAATMYPNVENVHSIALYLYERALRDNAFYAKDFSGTLRETMGKLYLQSAEVLLRTEINRLGEILPIAWNISQDLGTLEKLVPQTIAGNEYLYKFWRKIAYWYGAERALLRMQSLNKARLDDENPETMGNIEFLRREKRSKGLIELRIAEYFIPIYENLQDQEAINATEMRIRLLRHAENRPVIAEIDALLQRGEYLLAEQKIKKLPNDASALLRYAHITHIGGRIELFRRIMSSIESEQDLFNTSEKKLYEELYSFL